MLPAEGQAAEQHLMWQACPKDRSKHTPAPRIKWNTQQTKISLLSSTIANTAFQI